MIDLRRAAARSTRASRVTLGFASIVGGLFLGVAACSADVATDGAPNPDGKGEGAACTDGLECMSLVCTSGKCAAVSGGRCGAAGCADGASCAAAVDCKSGVCKGGTCAAGRPDDGVKNGDETDVDCGGAKASKCAVGSGCGRHEDCASDACSYAKRCVEHKSCTGHFGGDTCGAGETGGANVEHESCCATVTGESGVAIGKYQVTAGRMRAFVERYGGDLQAWAATSPDGWNEAWNDQLPSSMEEALIALGPDGKRGCDPEAKGARTYWQEPIDGDPERKSDFSRDVLDEKALNCVTWYMAQALCAFDGGRLVNADEVVDLMTNGGETTLPWEFQDGSAYDVKSQDPRVVHNYSYETPNPPGDMRTESGGGPLDRAFFIAPPGRRPSGADRYGAMDAVGNMLPWVFDEPRSFVYTLSWENHPRKDRAEYWKGEDDTDAYYAIGARCAYP